MENNLSNNFLKKNLFVMLFLNAQDQEQNYDKVKKQNNKK